MDDKESPGADGKKTLKEFILVGVLTLAVILVWVLTYFLIKFGIVSGTVGMVLVTAAAIFTFLYALFLTIWRYYYIGKKTAQGFKTFGKGTKEQKIIWIINGAILIVSLIIGFFVGAKYFPDAILVVLAAVFFGVGIIMILVEKYVLGIPPPQ